MASKSPWQAFADWFRPRRAAPVKTRKATTPSTSSHPYRAVSIVVGKNACAAAHRFKGMRFLSRQAPRLPLPTCDAAQCDCRFRHHADRRAGPRRRGEQGMMQPLWQGTERRRAGGRRADDV
ncbi:MAG TPA: hypothetical protein PKE27_06730 [Povalibacter sp.]|uniref:hypothetical protein n=1 Tax=Povalibacter sp. TaxID=1962978 RepID=UPI002C1F0D8D|nr:hypothetical protein [Povalibacter sp.]HMN44246.1 hypothetical protein [Povalibacter sp.]